MRHHNTKPTLRNYREIVKTLSNADGGVLFSGDVRRTLMNCFRSVGVMIHTLHKGYRLARVRFNPPGVVYTRVRELSYRPIGVPGGPQRANTKATTRFYGASCERRIPEPITDEDYGIKVALFETLPSLRENCHHGFGACPPSGRFPDFFISPFTSLPKARVTYSIWEVSDNLELASVCPLKIHDEDWGTQLLRAHLNGSYVMAAPHSRCNEDVFWNFLTATFASLGVPTARQPDYLVSSVAAELLTDKGFAGVSYPSTRCMGLGINVAITPKATDERLVCKKVGIVDLKIERNRLKLNYGTCVELNPETNIFSL